MKKAQLLVLIFCTAVLVCQFVPVAHAAGTAAEAQSLVEKAMKFYEQNGQEKAIAAFNDSNGEFVKGDLYIFMFNYDGLTLAHGTNPKLIGKNVGDLKDANGKLFVQEFLQKVKSGGGWVDYQWTNPETKKIQDKSSFVKGISGKDLYIGCGIYK
jgi:cytochrome c